MEALVTSVLQRARPSPQHMKIFIEPRALEQFEIALTHKSYNSEFNYDFYEWLGDPICDLYASEYVREHYTFSMTYMTAMTQQYLKKEGLGRVSQILNLPRYIRMSDEYQKEIQPELSLPGGPKIWSDVTEAFIGCIMQIASRHWEQGTVNSFIKAILYSAFSEMKFSTKYEDLFSAKDRLKIIYDSQGWKFDKSLWTKKHLPTIRIMVFEPPRKLIAMTRAAADTRNARRRLFTIALEYLESIGITTQVIGGEEERLTAIYEEHQWPRITSLLTIKDIQHGVELRLHAPFPNPNFRPRILLEIQKSNDVDSQYQKAINILKQEWGVELQPPDPYIQIPENPEDATDLPINDEFRTWYMSLLNQTILNTDVRDHVFKSSIVEARMALTSSTYHERYNWKQFVGFGRFLYHWIIARMIRVYYYYIIDENQLTNIFQFIDTSFVDDDLAISLGIPQWILARDERLKHQDKKYNNNRHALYALIIVIYDAVRRQTSEAVAIETIQTWIIPRLYPLCPNVNIMKWNINKFLGMVYAHENKVLLKNKITEEEIEGGVRITLRYPDSDEVIAVGEGANAKRVRRQVYQQAATILSDLRQRQQYNGSH